MTIADNNLLVADRSLPLGTVRLLSKANQQYESVQKSVEHVFEKFNSKLKLLFKKHLSKSRPVLYIGTGGNIEALLKLRQNLLHKTDSKCVTKSELKQILRKLNSYTYLERIQILNLRPDRADVIVPATLTVLNIMECLGVNYIVVPNVGLKEGVLLELAKNFGKKKDPNTPLLWTLS